ncbi:MAG: hypothetical protein ABI036_07470 [Fibrobacteria bacterium]
MKYVTFETMRLKPMLKYLTAIFVFSAVVHAETRLYGLASIGEAPYQELSDVGGSTPVPQSGISAEFSCRYLTPFAKTLLGYYNHGLFAEEYIGVQLGAEIFRLKPALTFGAGIQSANEKRFTLGDDFNTIRRTYFPYGFGTRLDIFDKIYGEWDWRMGGYPWWKLEFGYRLF